MADYEKQANDFLNKHGITFQAIFKGDKCPPWDDDKHIHGDRYLCKFKRDGKRFSLSFWNSKHDQLNGNKPTAYDVLACLEKYEPEDFKNWAEGYGYDTDSRKVYKTYNAVCKEWDKVNAFFTDEELEELQEIN